MIHIICLLECTQQVVKPLHKFKIPLMSRIVHEDNLSRQTAHISQLIGNINLWGIVLKVNNGKEKVLNAPFITTMKAIEFVWWSLWLWLRTQKHDPVDIEIIWLYVTLCRRLLSYVFHKIYHLWLSPTYRGTQYGTLVYLTPLLIFSLEFNW